MPSPRNQTSFLRFVARLYLVAWFFWAQTSWSQEVVVIKLRSPNNSQDARFDPYYDVGEKACFGSTRCHRTNIMNPEKVADQLIGKRAAFVQQGFESESRISQQRLVFLTPVISEADIEIVGTDAENKVALLKWDGRLYKPFKFEFAPIVVSNDGRGIQELLDISTASARETAVAGFGSLFRTRIKPLDLGTSTKMIEAWETALLSDVLPNKNIFASHYVETMSPPPKTVDQDRESSLAFRIEKAKMCQKLLAGK